MTATKQPQYKAFVLTKRKDKKDFWTPVGVGFVHGDQAGINVMLQAIPLDRKIVLRPFDEKAPATGSSEL
jgi:hypothetical protein